MFFFIGTFYISFLIRTWHGKFVVYSFLYLFFSLQFTWFIFLWFIGASPAAISHINNWSVPLQILCFKYHKIMLPKQKTNKTKKDKNKKQKQNKNVVKCS